jgi:hypothetical protein
MSMRGLAKPESGLREAGRFTGLVEVEGLVKRYRHAAAAAAPILLPSPPAAVRELAGMAGYTKYRARRGAVRARR